MTTSRFDPRPESPAQLALIALGIWLVAAIVPLLHVFVPIGILLLVVAGVGQVLRPRLRTMYWRERRIELDEGPRFGSGLYRAMFKA